ncbi:peptidase U32 family protein [Texcoconibacillus texcoconensis]|nr:peptidase U32 family protein [Texcoconibacillus texcoconensis]
MPRYFNGREIELLAPSGNMDIFKQIVNANCDAIYIGGKSLNMRMIRKGFNFSDEEIVEATQMAHDRGKKLYVTVNSMLNDQEINQAIDYLHFLNNTKVDGIIIQDLGILQLCNEYKLDRFEIHASVMMNVHNIDFVKHLQQSGVSRVVVSREMDLQTAKHLQVETGIETEYFVHGDMCTVNGGNCYYSSLVLGNSSNRGRCFKPCRWAFETKKDGYTYPTEYPLAAKDMNMYEHIPELIESRVQSFKIEGRMRDTDFIVNLVNTYGDAIDRYIADPFSFDRNKKTDELFENRKRDFSTAYAFGNPGLDFINRRYEGTGKFYSTGKMFSTPTEEPSITNDLINDVVSQLSEPESSNPSPTKHRMSVKVKDYEQAKLCMESSVDRIYIPSEVFYPNEMISIDQLEHLRSLNSQTDIFLELPQMMDERQLEMTDQYLETHGHLFKGLLVSNLGAIQKYADRFQLVANYNLNIFNQRAISYYKDFGVEEFTVSIESKRRELGEFIHLSEEPLEIIAHGPLKAMYLDLNLYDNTHVLNPSEKSDNDHVENDQLVLKTEKGENPVYIDQFKKNHLYTAKEFNILPILGAFEKPISFRIEGHAYNADDLREIIDTYQKAIANPSQCDQLFEQLNSTKAGFTLGALSFK